MTQYNLEKFAGAPVVTGTAVTYNGAAHLSGASPVNFGDPAYLSDLKVKVAVQSISTGMTGGLHLVDLSILNVTDPLSAGAVGVAVPLFGHGSDGDAGSTVVHVVASDAGTIVECIVKSEFVDGLTPNWVAVTSGVTGTNALSISMENVPQGSYNIPV